MAKIDKKKEHGKKNLVPQKKAKNRGGKVNWLTILPTEKTLMIVNVQAMFSLLT